MAFHHFCFATCLSLALVGFSASLQADSSPWNRYSDPHHRFLIQYPATAEVDSQPNKEFGLLSRVAFKFVQAFDYGADAGSLKFSFQISVWQNTNHLTAEAWARQHIQPQFTLETHSVQIAGRKGVRVKTTNLAWTVIKTFVTDKDDLYELSYMDVAANKVLLSDGTRLHWTGIFGRMLESFRILSAADGSN